MIDEAWVDVGVENDRQPVRRFETFTADLNRMAEWLIDCGIRTVVMESTGVYWIPACQILEDRGIEVLLANPRYAKNVSGRKTDALDCQWLRTWERLAGGRASHDLKRRPFELDGFQPRRNKPTPGDDNHRRRYESKHRRPWRSDRPGSSSTQGAISLNHGGGFRPTFLSAA